MTMLTEFTANLVARTTEELLTLVVERNLLMAFAETTGHPAFRLPGTIREVAIALLAAEEACRIATRNADTDSNLLRMLEDEREMVAAARDLGVDVELPSHDVLERHLTNGTIERLYKLEHQARRGLITWPEHRDRITDIVTEAASHDLDQYGRWPDWAHESYQRALSRAVHIDANRQFADPTLEV